MGWFGRWMERWKKRGEAKRGTIGAGPARPPLEASAPPLPVSFPFWNTAPVSTPDPASTDCGSGGHDAGTSFDSGGSADCGGGGSD